MPTIRERNGKYQAQVRIKVDGVIVHQESATFDKRPQALRWGVALETKIEKEGIEAHRTRNTTLSALMDLHLAQLATLGRDDRSFTSRFKTMRLAAFTNKPIHLVTSSDIVSWAIKFGAGETPTRGKPRAPATVLTHLMGLSALYAAAPVAYSTPADKSVVANAINYLKGARVAATSNHRDRRVSDAEIDQIEAFHNKQPFTRIPMPTIARFLIALPRRRTEQMTALWEDYDPVHHTLILRDTKHPTKVRVETVPVPPKAQEILASMKRGTGALFPYNPKSLSSAFLRASKMLGLPNLHLHDLRHEGISRLFEEGLSIQHVALISGHTSWDTLKRYTHIKPSDVLDRLKEK